MTVKALDQKMLGETDQWKFTEEWIDSGLATFSEGRLKMNLMSGSAGARKERRQTQARQTHFWAFTDGAGPRDKNQKSAEMAGFGGVIIPATATGEADIVTFTCGILHGNREGEGETMGVTVATNNSGELCAIQGACRKAITALKRGDSTRCTRRTYTHTRFYSLAYRASKKVLGSARV
jgi:hypothetical protein